MSTNTPRSNAFLAVRYDIHVQTPPSQRGLSPDIASHPNDRFQMQCLTCGEPIWTDGGGRVRTACGDDPRRFHEADVQACHDTLVQEADIKRRLADFYEQVGVIYQELAAAKRAGDEERAMELEREAARLNVPGFQRTT